MLTPAITQIHPPMELNELVSRINSFPTLPLDQKYSFLDELVAIHPTLSLEWGPGHRFHRARNIESKERPKTIDEVIWNKNAPAKLGRLNPEGFQVLYVSANRDTALRETRIDSDSAVIAQFEIRTGRRIFVAPIGELSQIALTGRGFLSGKASPAISSLLNACPIHESRSLVITDAFLYQMIGHDDYQISSHVALAIFKKNESKLSAVAYSSQRQRGGMNLAILVDGFWENWGLVSVRCALAKHLALGFYELSQLTNVVGIYKSGKFQWENSLSENEEFIILNPPYYPAAN